MWKHFFDFSNGDLIFPFSDYLAMGLGGDLFLRTSDHTAIDMDSGDLHITSGWEKDDNEDD